MFVDLPVTVDATLSDPALVAYTTAVLIREP